MYILYVYMLYIYLTALHVYIFIFSFAHDMSELPLVVTRLVSSTTTLMNSSSLYTRLLYVLTLLNWIYWRLWIMMTVVLVSVVSEFKSRLYVHSECQPGHCSWNTNPDKYGYICLLMLLICMNIYWSMEILNKVRFGVKSIKLLNYSSAVKNEDKNNLL